jgi:hypothetical protein
MEKPEERRVVCSACGQLVPESLIHVIPCFNVNAGGYVTTYRCEQCWLPSLLETRTRLASTENEPEIASVATFFEQHGVFIHEFRRGDPALVLRKVLVRMIDLLRSETIRRPHATNDKSHHVLPVERKSEEGEAMPDRRRYVVWFSVALEP